MNTLTIKRSRYATGAYVLLGIIFAFIAAAMIYKDNLGGWCFIPISVIILFAGIGGMVDNSPRIIITDSGLMVRELGKEEISWHTIRSVSAEFMPRAGNTIILELHDGSKKRFYNDVLEMSPFQVYTIIKERASAKQLINEIRHG